MATNGPTTWETYFPPSAGTTGPGRPCEVNGVNFLRYRVTVEVIDEPDDVLRDRLMAIAIEGTNHHHHTQWRRLERRYGFVCGGYKQPARLANDDDRDRWAKEDIVAAEYAAKREAAEKAKRDERTAKARARRAAKKAAP